MWQYILECIAFQLVFLIIYDFFLKKETFFQWNRAYLIGTFVLSLVLPWIKIAALSTAVPEQYYVYPEYLWNLDKAIVIASGQNPGVQISWQQGLLLCGMLVAALFFRYKMLQLYRLRSKGKVNRYKEFTKIVLADSHIAFSFFKSIFLGDKVVEKEHRNIIEHELVHIRQRHTYDLLFFELMRIVGWFNPLVYVYQNRVSELHEFIADAQVSKSNKEEHCQVLLSRVFQTQNISFINQFFKSSLIKKRIVMLTKEKSRTIWKLKYLALVPMVLGMILYTSCEQEYKGADTEDIGTEDRSLIEQVTRNLKNDKSEEIGLRLDELMAKMGDGEILTKKEFFEFRIISYKVFSKPKVQVVQGDTLHFLGSNRPLRNPTENEYRYYVNRTKAFQTLDQDLSVSIGPELHIRKIEKEDQNLGPGEFVTVKNTADLTGDEIRKLNRTIADLDFENRFLFLSDGEHAFLITKVTQGDSVESSPDTETRLSLSDTIEVPFATVEEVPIFPGCEDAANPRACFQNMMQKHISKYFRYPDEAQRQAIQGRVAVMFTIDEEGNIINIQKRGAHELLENETERIIEKLPKMQPGKSKGKAVRVPFSIPINFKLAHAGFNSHSGQSMATDSTENGVGSSSDSD